MEPLERPPGYLVEDENAAKELLSIEAELLKSEGLDPKWPGFPEELPDKGQRREET